MECDATHFVKSYRGAASASRALIALRCTQVIHRGCFLVRRSIFFMYFSLENKK